MVDCCNCNDDTDDGYDALRYSVGLHEGVWKRVDRPGEPANREHMLMALAGLEYIIVKVEIWKYKFMLKPRELMRRSDEPGISLR